MRDIVLTTFVLGSLPFLLRRPDWAVLMWTWLSLMSPHRLTWGFAYDMPFAQIVGIVLLVSVLLWREPKRIPWSPLTLFWALFVVWICVTTLLALNPTDAWDSWDKSIKIQISSFIILMVMTTPWRLKAFVAVVAMSIGFYGVKGGVFTVLGGGMERVLGPPGSFIEGNNELALAMIVVMPLLWFLKLQMKSRWLASGFVAAMVLCAFSVVGSQSRGAFLAVGAMGLFLVLKSRRRVALIAALAVLIPIMVSFAPEKYWDRMETIKTYEQDSSAMGRINAWMFAFNLAKDHPITGGGFETFTPQLFHKYAPNPRDFHDVHSIYFEILGEQGFVGFALYMGMALMAYVAAGRTARRAAEVPDADWQVDLARMVQVSLVGYGAGGAFLGLAYFDLLFDLYAIVVLNRVILERRIEALRPRQPAVRYYGAPSEPAADCGGRVASDRA